jgi:4'-phosphopantetheinyl transferase
MTGPSPWRCEPGEVHIWRTSLDVPPIEAEKLALYLDVDERQRVRRFLLERERQRYIVHRARLRAILSSYLGAKPEDVRLSRNENGRPFITGESSAKGLRFSAAHSDGMALYSLSRGLETGIDVERIRDGLARPWIAERFFTPLDSVRLGELAGAEYIQEFFTCWTRLEARLKALGHGFTEDRASQREDLRVWAVHDLAPGPGYAGAIAIEGDGHAIVGWDLLPRQHHPMKPSRIHIVKTP